MIAKRECTECKQDFSPRTGNQKVCSNTCRDKIKARKHMENWCKEDKPKRKPSWISDVKLKRAQVYYTNTTSTIRTVRG